MTLLVAHPRWRALPELKGKLWVYGDSRLEVYAIVAATLGLEHRLVLPREFQQRAQTLRDDFVVWADDNINDADEWVLTPLHRNPFGNDLLVHLVWIDLLAERAVAEDVVVLTESPGLAATLCAHMRQRGVTVIRHGRDAMAISFWLRHRLRPAARFSRDVIHVLVRMLMSRLLLRKGHVARCRLAAVLVDSFLHDGEVGRGGTYRNRYMPGLMEWYESKGIVAGILPFAVGIPFRHLASLYTGMSRSATLFIPFERFVTWSDWIAAVVRVLGSAFSDRRGAASFKGIDTAVLVAELRPQAALESFLALLFGRAPQRLVEAGIRPSMVVDWFENQPLDRALALGIRRAMPATRLVGLRQYTIDNFANNLFVTDKQAACLACPQATWVSGQAMISQLQRHDSTGAYSVVPALRYGHLYRSAPKYGGRKPFVLLLLTHSLEETLGIFDCALPALAELYAEDCRSVLVKPHPDMSVPHLRTHVHRRWPAFSDAAWLEWTQTPVADLLADATIVITGGTSAALEAVCRGVPVVIIGRSAGLNMNSLSQVDARLWTVAYDSVEVERTIRGWSPSHSLPRTERMAIGDTIRAKYFEPASNTGMALFDPPGECPPKGAST